jgi:hypothetical protein
MSRMLELPDDVYARLLDEAAACGVTPVEWIVSRLPRAAASSGDEPSAKPTQTLAERFAGRVGVIDTGPRARAAEPPPQTLADFLEGHIGVINCGGGESLAADHSRYFGEYLEQKRRDGRL